MEFTILQAPVTKTAAFAGAGADVSALMWGAVAKVRVTALTVGKSARLSIQASADSFVSDVRTVRVLHFEGAITAPADVVQSVTKAEILGGGLGVAGTEWRINLEDIDAGGSITYEAWIES